MINIETFNIILYTLFFKNDSLGCEKIPGATVHSQTEKEAKMERAVELYVKKHMNTREIAKQMLEEGFEKCSYVSIANYIKEARQEWKENRLQNMDEAFERELAELDALEAETAKLFYDFEERIKKDDPYQASKEANDWVKSRLKIKEQRQKLLGLNSPVKMQHSGEVKINLTVADCGEEGFEDIVEEELPEDD